ncbi:MAG: hypothetical protein SV375_09630 [Thermodesulfobacteriota bacterium]|nr:hypothetical protein [Thermodesulfobacteriota bacterium]
MKDIDTNKKLCSFIESKLALFKSYLSITRGMKETLGNKKVDNLGDLILKRQDCIQRIEKVDLSIDQIIRGGGQKLIDSNLTNLRDIMKTVDLMDRELIVMIKEECEGIKTETLKMQNVRQAARGYKGAGRYAPMFLNTVR